MTIAPGLERLLAEELADLGLDAEGDTEDPGGVMVRVTPTELARVALHCRTGGRLTVRLARVKAPNLEVLADGVRKLPWKTYVHPGRPLDVRAATRGSRLRHASTVARKVELAIGDALKGPRKPGPRPPREPLRVQVRVVGDRATLSVDASGELLHKRGWRQLSAKAPLRENRGVALLRATGWTPDQPLVDPMAGSGTFGIEAAMQAAGLPPGLGRSYAFESWPTWPGKLTEVARRWRSEHLPVGRAPILVADRDPGAVRAVRANAERAGVLGRLTVQQAAFRDLTPPASTGVIVLNPPWGERIGDRGKTPEVLASIAGTLRHSWGGWRFGMLVPRRWDVHERLGLDAEQRIDWVAGGLPVQWIVGRVRT